MEDMETASSFTSDHSPTSTEIFTVFARDTPFRLTRSQIETDSPNYFTSAFLSHDFAESTTHEIRTDKNPLLFSLIVEHLSGYTVLPLQPRSLPPSMSVEAAHENVLRDARYFGLEQLESLLSPPEPPPTLPNFVSSFVRATQVYSLDRVCEGGDLAFDTKVYRPFHHAQALPVADHPKGALFLCENVAMMFSLEPTQSLVDGALELDAANPFPEKYRRARGSDRMIDLQWNQLVSRSYNLETTVVKLNNETLNFDLMARLLTEVLATYPEKAFFEYDSLKVPVQRSDLGGMHGLTFSVIAESMIVSICSESQNQGYDDSARVSLVYAEFKTMEEWTKTHLAPALTRIVGLLYTVIGSKKGVSEPPGVSRGITSPSVPPVPR